MLAFVGLTLAEVALPSTASAASPFTPGVTTSIHEQYGYAGLRWNTYDLGCAGSPEASVGSTVANWLFTVPKAVVAATGAMLGSSFEPRFLSVFDPLITNVTDALRRSVFDQWAGLVIAAVGFFTVWRARQASLRSTAAGPTFRRREEGGRRRGALPAAGRHGVCSMS
ncbi:MAG TPA: hypothetical protein VI248_30155 [Kineosporiaceae bacterium]